jgi:hypothetical protein
MWWHEQLREFLVAWHPGGGWLGWLSFSARICLQLAVWMIVSLLLKFSIVLIRIAKDWMIYFAGR